jgi:2-dehydropantoate 2-reductase
LIYIHSVITPSYTIFIAGFGALGTVFGTLLKKAGHTVFALTKTKYLSALENRRVRVSGIWGEHEAVLDGIYDSITPLADRKIDLIVLTVKSYDTREAIEQVQPLVSRDTLVVVAQNGYGNYETVSGVVGKEHALLARIIFGAKVTAPGKAEVTVIADDVRIGQPQNAVDPERIKAIASAFKTAGPNMRRMSRRSSGTRSCTTLRSIPLARSSNAPTASWRNIPERGRSWTPLSMKFSLLRGPTVSP